MTNKSVVPYGEEVVPVKVQYREVSLEELNAGLFAPFNRYQEVKRCWRQEEGHWVIKDNPFTEQWGEREKGILVQCLRNTVQTGGTVWGAFQEHILVGFASLESQFFGAQADYLQLSSIHTSYELRGSGIGRELFQRICRRAAAMGAKKLYISAHSAEESQAFYEALGCTDALEIQQRFLDAEPWDRQLEYRLTL